MVIPYISRDDVSAALTSLIHSARNPEATGLRQLLLVDLRVNTPDMPASDAARSLAVRDLLVGEIAAALMEQRRTFGLAAPDDSAPNAKALAELAENVAIGAPELLAWTVLYYRYVRSDLDLSVERLAELLAVHPRTISRYNDEGIARLTERLIRAEQNARQQQIERRLYAALPYSVPLRMVGRDDLLVSTEKTLEALSPRHLLVTGATGIGKTLFVQELLRHQIDAGKVDQLVWLDRPRDASMARQQIAEALLREDGQISLREYLLLYRVAIVLDEIDMAVADREIFVRLLSDLGAALVCLINRAYVPLENVEAHVPLTEITQEAAEAVVSGILHAHPSIDPEDRRQVTQELYGYVGGNPLALKLAAGLWEDSESWRVVQSEIHEWLFGNLFDRLSAQERRTWCALALVPQPATLDDLSALWTVRSASVGALLRLALLERDKSAAYRLVSGACDYVQERYATDPETRRLLNELVNDLQPGGGAFAVQEAVLFTGFPEIGVEQRANWIDLLWEEGLRRGHWARWRAILEAHMREAGAVEPLIRVAYGVCLRRLGDWEGARQVFYAVVTECGRNGRFAEQARALVEWSTLAKYQGDYEQALGFIGQAKRYAQRTRDDELLRSLVLQEAQLLIQQGAAADAYRLLSPLPQSARVLALESEAQLALGNMEACRSLASRALEQLTNDPPTEVSLYTVIGRSFAYGGDHRQAQRHLTSAVTLLERSDDVYSLARAQTNLAAVLIPMGHLPDAEVLLSQAEEVQVRLGDKVGLNATRHNRGILRGDIAR